MARASASSTNDRVSPSDGFIKRTRNPSLQAPARFERVPKAPGSLELVNGRFVEVGERA